jgi:hypothetical protein
LETLEPFTQIIYFSSSVKIGSRATIRPPTGSETFQSDSFTMASIATLRSLALSTYSSYSTGSGELAGLLESLSSPLIMATLSSVVFAAPNAASQPVCEKSGRVAEIEISFTDWVFWGVSKTSVWPLLRFRADAEVILLSEAVTQFEFTKVMILDIRIQELAKTEINL